MTVRLISGAFIYAFYLFCVLLLCYPACCIVVSCTKTKVYNVEPQYFKYCVLCAKELTQTKKGLSAASSTYYKVRVAGGSRRYVVCFVLGLFFVFIAGIMSRVRHTAASDGCCAVLCCCCCSTACSSERFILIRMRWYHLLSQTQPWGPTGTTVVPCLSNNRYPVGIHHDCRERAAVTGVNGCAVRNQSPVITNTAEAAVCGAAGKY